MDEPEPRPRWNADQIRDNILRDLDEAREEYYRELEDEGSELQEMTSRMMLKSMRRGGGQGFATVRWPNMIDVQLPDMPDTTPS